MADPLDSQTAYWNKVAEEKTFTHALDAEKFNRIVSLDADVLDFGCGYGRISNTLYEHGYRNVIGLDLSGKMIARGRAIYPHLHLKTATPERWPGLAESFDAVILFAVLTCIPTNKGQEVLLNQIGHVLRPGGILYISDYWLQTDDRNRHRYQVFEEKYGVYGVFELPDGAVFRHHDRPWLQSLLCHFDTLYQDDMTVTTMNGNQSQGFQYFGKKAEGGLDG